jgi:hypothetical protein
MSSTETETDEMERPPRRGLFVPGRERPREPVAWDARHSLVTVIAVTAAVCLLIWMTVNTIARVTEFNNERKVARIEACRTLENEAVEALCLERA